MYWFHAVSWYGRHPKRCSLAQDEAPVRVYVLRTTALSRSETVYTSRLGTEPLDTCITSYRYGLRTVPENSTVVVRCPARSSSAVPSAVPARMVGTAIRSPVGLHRVQG